MIHGKQVTLRPLESADAAELTAINNDPVVRSNVVGWAWPNSLDQQSRWIAEQGGGSTHRWAVLDADERVIGLTGLWDVDLHNRNALTALKLGGRHGIRGQGVGSDAIKTVMAFAFYDVGLERLYSTIIETNEASRRAYCDKCGWSVEGVLRNHVWRHGEFQNLLQVGILKREFEALPDAEAHVDLIRNGRA